MRSTLRFPVSIFDTSRISSMRPSRCSALRLTLPEYSRRSVMDSASGKSSAYPRIDIIGVRSSWLMFAKKAVFATAAALESRRASASSW